MNPAERARYRWFMQAAYGCLLGARDCMKCNDRATAFWMLDAAARNRRNAAAALAAAKGQA